MKGRLIPLNGYFNHLKEGGFILDIQTIKMMNINRQHGRLVLYFNVNRMGRDDEEIGMLARQHKIELYLITGYPNIGIKYNIVG